jgi:hypothetical protein
MLTKAVAVSFQQQKFMYFFSIGDLPGKLCWKILLMVVVAELQFAPESVKNNKFLFVSAA